MEKDIELAKQEAAAQQRLAAMFSANKDEISIPKIYVDMTEDIKAAAVLDEIMFWTLPKRGKTSLRVFRNGSLWLAVRRSDWWDRKRLTERQADTAIEKLIELDLIEKDLFLFDGKPTVHIRVKMSNFVKLYGEKLLELIPEEESAARDIADLYEMMGFHENVNSNLQNGEMLNLQNGEIINSLPQPPNTSKGISEKTKREILKNSDPAWRILAGEEVTQEDQDKNILIKTAQDSFERDMGFNPLPWDSTKDWQKMSKFVVQEYEKDNLIFAKYKTWQKEDGKYVALSNRKIKERPGDFIACFPDFLAHTAMYPKVEKIEDDNDDFEFKNEIYI